MISVGLTGGMGSGKSSVCRVWGELGAYIADSDKLAKELMTVDPELVKSIKRKFGEEAYLPDGSLNRSYLAAEAFTRNRSNELNSIVHPAVRSRVAELKDEAAEKGYPVFVQEAAILLERGRPPGFDYIILVTAPIKDRIRWIRNRSSLTETEILNRMKKQKTDTELSTFCDFIIVNDSTLKQLEEKSTILYHKLLDR